MPGREVVSFSTEHDLSEGAITYRGTASSVETTRRVAADVSGAVATVAPGGENEPIVVGVVVGNGNRLEYSLFGRYASADVSPGTAVGPSTIIGRIGRPDDSEGPAEVRLRLQAFETGTEAPLNPDCVEE